MSPTNFTSRSDARTIAMLRRKLAASEACLNHYKNSLIVMREFVEDTDTTDEEDVVLSNNFIITQCNQLLSTNVNNIYELNEESNSVENAIDLVDETDDEMPPLMSCSDEESDAEMDEETDAESDEEPDVESDEETDIEMDDGVDYENLVDYINNYSMITINAIEYFLDDYNYSGHQNLLMVYSSNGDLEPVGTFNGHTIIYESFGYNYIDDPGIISIQLPIQV